MVNPISQYWNTPLNLMATQNFWCCVSILPHRSNTAANGDDRQQVKSANLINIKCAVIHRHISSRRQCYRCYDRLDELHFFWLYTIFIYFVFITIKQHKANVFMDSAFVQSAQCIYIIFIVNAN